MAFSSKGRFFTAGKCLEESVRGGIIDDILKGGGGRSTGHFPGQWTTIDARHNVHGKTGMLVQGNTSRITLAKSRWVNCSSLKLLKHGSHQFPTGRSKNELSQHWWDINSSRWPSCSRLYECGCMDMETYVPNCEKQIYPGECWLCSRLLEFQ